MAMHKDRALDILLVEDNPGDVRLTQEAFRESHFHHRLHVAADGDLALRFLRREPPYEECPRPDLIVLDLNLPKRDGRQVLEEIKQSQEFRAIPVVVLTTSKAQEDVQSAYGLHANCYIQKPLDLHNFLSVVRAIESFWLTIVTLPVCQHT